MSTLTEQIDAALGETTVERFLLLARPLARTIGELAVAPEEAAALAKCKAAHPGMHVHMIDRHNDMASDNAELVATVCFSVLFRKWLDLRS